jgi:ADP-L-glycero-D-manno-heptose 6-epimerase
MKRILITGHNGFIGSNLLSCIDSHYEVKKSDYSSYSDGYHPDNITDLSKIDIVVHMGAISSTNSIDKEELFQKNIFNTLNIFSKAKHAKIIYASSASTYGLCNSKRSELDELNPQSIYAKSKSIVDNIVLNFLSDRKIVGLRFFNVCSFSSESNKTQPSPTYSFMQQLIETKKIKLFANSDKIFRDFIFIDDVIKIIKYFIEHDIDKSRIINVGTGNPISFEAIADSMINKFGFGEKTYIKKPSDILSSYQNYTEADITLLRHLGYNNEIPSVLDYIKKYEH